MSIDTTTHRTIVGLKVQNFMRIETAEIAPNPNDNIITVSGANANGKSSLLNGIWAALESSAAARNAKITKPVREGADKATVEIDLGDLKIVRQWTAAGKSTIQVTSPEGAKYPRPQQLLDSMLGKLTFDPLAFTRLNTKDQTSTLLSLVDLGIDLDQIAEERASIYDARTQVGRDIKAVGEVETINPDLPDTPQSAQDILGAIQDAQKVQQEHDTARFNISECEEAINYNAARIEQLEAEIKDLKDANTELSDTHRSLKVELEQLPAVPDVDKLTSKLSGLEALNDQIRHNNQQKDKADKLAHLNRKRNDLTAEIDALDTAKTDALASAKFPLEGLSFNDEGITYNGQPLNQASAAEQLRVSAALAMALNPSIRIMRITDGSLMDSTSQKLLSDIAAEYNFQVWVELVSETGDVGFVIEDGKVKQ